MCSLDSTTEGDANATRGLKMLLPGLLHTMRRPDALEPRMQCLLGAKEAISTGLMRIPMGASHGIGHQLGPLGVPHGETSCVLLPAVMAYNYPVNGAKQAKVLEVLWSETSIADVLNKRGVAKSVGSDVRSDIGTGVATGEKTGVATAEKNHISTEEENASLTTVLDAILRELQMPRSLKEVGVGRDMLEQLAEGSLEDRWCRSNPVPLRERGQVLEILEMVVG